MNEKPVEFSRTVDGLDLKVRYWPKDFEIEYNHPRYGLFSYGAHIPHAMPKTYSEKSVEERLPEAARIFKAAGTWLDENPDALEKIFQKETDEISKIRGEILEIERKKQSFRDKLEKGLIEKAECRRAVGKLKAERNELEHTVRRQRENELLSLCGGDMDLYHILDDVYRRRHGSISDRLSAAGICSE